MKTWTDEVGCLRGRLCDDVELDVSESKYKAAFYNSRSREVDLSGICSPLSNEERFIVRALVGLGSPHSVAASPQLSLISFAAHHSHMSRALSAAACISHKDTSTMPAVALTTRLQ